MSDPHLEASLALALAAWTAEAQEGCQHPLDEHDPDCVCAR